MSIVTGVRDALARSNNGQDQFLNGALADAERMANEYAEVQPQSYVVPIEKFVGLPVMGESKLASYRSQR